MGNPFLPLLDSIPFSPPLWKSNLSIWGLLIRFKLRFIKFNCTGCNWQLIIVRAKFGKSFCQTHLQVILCDISVHIFLPFDIVLYVSLTWARESLDSRAWVRGIFFFFILSFLDNVAHDPCKVMRNPAEGSEKYTVKPVTPWEGRSGKQTLLDMVFIFNTSKLMLEILPSSALTSTSTLPNHPHPLHPWKFI